MANYHLELRHFPRVSVRFNQTGTQVGAIVLPWVQDRVFELDEEKWAPYDAELTIIEGPAIAVQRLSMGRGWATAQREGTDVTERVLGEARAALADGSAPVQGAVERPAAPVPQTSAEPRAASDYPTLAGASAVAAASTPQGPVTEAEMHDLLGSESERLLSAWRAVASRTGGLAPSESLALAERELSREDSGEA